MSAWGAGAGALAALSYLAGASSTLGRTERAVEYSEQLLAVARELDDRAGDHLLESEEYGEG